MTLQVEAREVKSERIGFRVQPAAKRKLEELVSVAKGRDQRASMASVVESLIMQAKVRK